MIIKATVSVDVTLDIPEDLPVLFARNTVIHTCLDSMVNNDKIKISNCNERPELNTPAS
jgi:hypothetical protein